MRLSGYLDWLYDVSEDYQKREHEKNKDAPFTGPEKSIFTLQAEVQKSIVEDYQTAAKRELSEIRKNRILKLSGIFVAGIFVLSISKGKEK